VAGLLVGDWSEGHGARLGQGGKQLFSGESRALGDLDLMPGLGHAVGRVAPLAHVGGRADKGAAAASAAASAARKRSSS